MQKKIASDKIYSKFTSFHWVLPITTEEFIKLH